MTEHPDWTTVKEYRDITYRKASGVARIAFNRPETYNSLDKDGHHELTYIWRDIDDDDDAMEEEPW